jgi:polyisoprenoid-binding protein YceI
MSRVVSLFILLMSLRIGVNAQTKFVEALRDESSVAYRLSHLLHTIDAVSKDVTYRLEVDEVKKEIKSVSAQVDVTTFDSGNSNRDSHAMEVIDAIIFPYTTFTSTAVVQHADSLFVTGKLTFHGVTKEVVMRGLATWMPNKIAVHGNFVVSLTAFKVERPALLMVPVKDELEFSLTAAFGL